MYNLPEYSSDKYPITVISLGSVGDIKPVAFMIVLPKTFSNEPISSSSDLPTDIFCASLYSPLGINLSSKSLFILDFRKLFLISAMY